MSPSPSAPDVESPASPSSLPTTSLFLPPKGPAAPLPPPSPSSSTSDPSPTSGFLDDAAPTWSGDSEASAETSSGRDESSDTPSTGSSLSVSRAGLRAAIGQGLRTVTRVISRIAADPAEQQYGVWQADRDDVQDISAPASRLVWRRLPEDARSSDTVDLVVLVLAVVGYVAKNLDAKWEVARARAAGQLVDVDGTTGDAGAPEGWPGPPLRTTAP